MRRLFFLCAAVSVLALGARGGDLVLRGPWSGAVTHDSAVVVAKLATLANGAWLELSHSVDFGEVTRVEALPALAEQSPEIARFALTGLSPNTPYYYRVRLADVPRDPSDDRSHGTFTTFPPPLTPSSFHFAFASCARTGSTHQVFRQIALQGPSFYLMTGDLHYEDISWNHLPSFRSAYDTVLGSERQRALYRMVPIIYTWDDHDFGPNGSDRHSPSRAASHAVYREYVPHYPLAAPGDDGPIAQAFTFGRVRFLVLDTRSA
ncbi:MAG: alkaline phosphatase D family protein, partial [Candidatus Didemnitutus sp.]|nr:alkaline phosphatase D family protein [Candidatus Didemnitutus sp.]